VVVAVRSRLSIWTEPRPAASGGGGCQKPIVDLD
jgi:hypothetical protein